MRIAAMTLRGAAGWATLELPAVFAGLNTIYGPPGSGKTTLADLLGHALFGKPPATVSVLGQRVTPSGEVVVESGEKRFRVRRFQDARGPITLTVASLDGTQADPGTIHKLVRGLSPTVLSRLCAISFRQPPDFDQLLSSVFAKGCRWANSSPVRPGSRRTAELAARRDLLAQELETRIAGERRVSTELEGRWRELDRLVRDEQQQVATLEKRLNTVETSLAETDARLRYRRLELNVELRWQAVEPIDDGSELAELDEQVTRWRGVLSEMAQREATLRARMAHLESSRAGAVASINDQRAWLAVGRQLSADLAGEVSRLARASGSEQCVCRDAHPRLRPIAETIERQLGSLEKLIDEQNRAHRAAEQSLEANQLAGSQAELRRHVEHLLDRRQALARASMAPCEDTSGAQTSFSAADAEQLQSRRLELEQQRLELIEQLRTHARVLRDVRAQRETVDRQRAAVLSARSIEHVQRELAAVQQKLESAANGGEQEKVAMGEDASAEASDFLAKLTNGELVQLILAENERGSCVTNRAGETLCFDSLSATQRDQVYLSLCLAVLRAASRQGIWLPLVLDEPCERFDPRDTAALAAVLHDFSRQGHQVLIFTGQRAAAERLASLGAPVHDILALRQRESSEAPDITSSPSRIATIAGTSMVKRPTKSRRKVDGAKRPKAPTGESSADSSLSTDQSDAA